MKDVVASSGNARRQLPVIVQSELAECGTVCLLMVVNYHGNRLSITELREIAPAPATGLTLLGLMRDASRLNMTTRPLRLELEELKDLQIPCILHWDLSHFVVLKSVNKAGVEIHDPARGYVRMSIEEAGKHFTGVALELAPSEKFLQSMKNERRFSLSSLFGRTVGLRRALLHVVGLALVLEGFVLVTPLYMQWVIDQVIVSGDGGLLNLIAVGFVFVCVFRAMVTALRSWVITWIGANLNAQWESNLFKHLLALKPSFFEKRHVGDILSRFTSVKSIQNSLSTQFVGTMLDGVMSLLTLGLMLSYSVNLTLFVIGAFACYLVLRHVFFGPLRTGNEKKIEFSAEQQSCLIESVRGARALQLSNQQPAKAGEYANKLIQTINKDVQVQRLQIYFEICNSLIFGLCRVAVVWLSARLVMEGDISAGMLISFVAYADMFSQRGANFINQIFDLKMLGMHAERVAEVALTKPEECLYPTSNIKPLDASLEVRNLSFRYSRDEPWILRNVSFKIDAGECVAFVGPSGSGKSTLAKLILGLLEPEQGQILYGGQNINQLGRVPFRDLVSSVMQDDSLFAGTIAANIAFFDPQLDMERVRKSASMAQVHQDITAMAMGYHTFIGDMGSSLSGGQKQRVLFARALYRNPSLLILDEATSHLDVACERMVNEVVSQLALTRIIIAHRPETIATASRVINLADFKSVEVSDHLVAA
jgi:ATP-binding cassette subfamily B protein RaxB